MCGIFGHLASSGADLSLVERMAHCLAHRGPDGHSTYQDHELAFGAGRLSIIDLTAPPGVIFNEDRQVAVVFNGEIYNYQSLRKELERAGHQFSTHTDTEVIVHGYEQWGLNVLDRLRGMFAIGVWDASRRRLMLARDRLGEKPLYYAHLGTEFLFASEIKAILEHPAIVRQVNPEALTFYLTLGYTPPPMTMFQGVSKLAAGQFLLVEQGRTRIESYWCPVMDTQRSPRPYPEAVKAVRAAVFEAVETRLMSDVPLGAFLSGGLDSTAVTAIMTGLTGKAARTFTVGYGKLPGAKNDADLDHRFNEDARFAALASKRLGTEHHTLKIRQDEHLAWLLPHLIGAMDEPISQPAVILTCYVSALARQNGVPVLLSGDAGDELFAGYPSYRADQVLARYMRVPALLRTSLLTPLLERLPARFDSLRKMAQKSRQTDPLRHYLHWNRLNDPVRFPGLFQDESLAASTIPTLERRLLPLLNAPRTPHFADRIAFTALNLWIPEDSNMRVDKMAMSMSIEARAPLEDHLLVDLAFSLPLEYKLRAGDFKRVFKDAVADLVPPEILRREKVGFFPPASEWLRTILRPLVETYLAPERVAAVGIFRPETVSALVKAHVVERKYELWSLWTLLTFHLWHAIYISGDLHLGQKITPADVYTAAESVG